MPHPIMAADALMEQFERFVCELNMSDKDSEETVAELESKRSKLPKVQLVIWDEVVYNFLWVEPDARRIGRQRGDLDKYLSGVHPLQRLTSGGGK